MDHCLEEFCLRIKGWLVARKIVSRGEFSLVGKNHNSCLLMKMYESGIIIMSVMMQERKESIPGVAEKGGPSRQILGSSMESLPVLTGGKASTWWRPWQQGTVVAGQHGVSSNCFLLIQELGNKVVR